METLPSNVLQQILSRTDTSTTAAVCQQWNSMVNKNIGRTVNLEYHDWVLNKGLLQHDLPRFVNYDMFKSNYEKQLIGKLRRLSIGARKLRLYCPSSRPPIGARAVCPYGMFLEDIVIWPALEIVGFSLLDLATYIHRISPWWTGITIPLFSVTLYFLGTQTFHTVNMIRMKGIGLAHRHLLESVSIEFPPSRSLYSVILKNCTHIKHFHLMPQSLEGMKPKDVKNIRIPTLTCLSLSIALNEYSNSPPNKVDMALAFLNNNYFPALKTLWLNLGVLSHQDPLSGEPMHMESGEIFKTITAALGFVAKHDGLEKLVCHQSFFECDARFQGLSHAQRFVQRVPGPYCVGEFRQNVLDELEKRARELSLSMRKLRTIKIKQVAKVHNTFVSSFPTFVQRGPQAVIWKKFLEHQNQCQNLSLGMPGLPQAFIERFFERAGVHLKSLELTHLMYNLGVQRFERFDCECFRYCPNVQKLVLAGAPPHFGIRCDCTLDPPLILAGVREGFPPQLKEVAICNLKLTSQDAQFILVELGTLESVHLSRVGKQGPNGVLVETVRQVVQLRRLKRLFLLDSTNGQILFGHAVRINPAGYLRILSVPGGRNNEPMNWIELNWVKLNKDSGTGYYEQLEQAQYQNEESKLYI